MQGLKSATVIRNVDPEGLARINVAWPEMPNGQWARVANVYATNGAGFCFLPEVGDEVVIAFLNDNADEPIVIGSLYNKNNHPPEQRGITSHSKIEISFDDEKKMLTVKTPGGNSITIDDDSKSIAIKDQNGNNILMSAEGISLDSAKNITLNARGKIQIESNGSGEQPALDIRATGNINIHGTNISATADLKALVTGNAAAELSATGQTTIKGAMVMIN